MRVKLFPNFTCHHLITQTNLIAFIISIETEASLLALAKSTYYCKKKKKKKITGGVKMWYERHSVVHSPLPFFLPHLCTRRDLETHYRKR